MRKEVEEFFNNLENIRCSENECKYFFINEDDCPDCKRLEELWKRKCIRYWGCRGKVSLCPISEK